MTSDARRFATSRKRKGMEPSDVDSRLQPVPNRDCLDLQSIHDIGLYPKTKGSWAAMLGALEVEVIAFFYMSYVSQSNLLLTMRRLRQPPFHVEVYLRYTLQLQPS